MRLSEHVYLVAGGDYGFNLTHRLDCHVYAIDTGDEIVLVDAGFGPGTDQIVEHMRADGLDPARVSRIVITHYHADHAGGCAPMVRATGAELWAPAEVADVISAADGGPTGLDWARSFGFYPADYVWEPSQVTHTFNDGDAIPAGDLELRAVETPGHCAGHFVLLLRAGGRGYLFASDLVFWGGAIILQNVPDSNLQAYAASMNKAAELEFDALLPAHHMISMANGKRHVLAAAQDFNRIGLPRDLLR